MKVLIPVLMFVVFFSCKKDNSKWMTATVTQLQGCAPNSWIVKMDNPNPADHPFLCDPTVAMLSSSTIHCGNSVVILNLPVDLTTPGTQIKFSQWKDKGLLCFSSTLAPHNLEVTDVSAK